MKKRTGKYKGLMTGSLIVVLLIASTCFGAEGGTLDTTRTPTDGSGMPTLQGLYEQLNSGAPAVNSTSFQEPGAGPTAGTGKALSDIQGKLPAADNTNGATTGDVLSGRTFWGLRTDGTWGLKTGSLSSRDNVTGVNGLLNFTIPDGYYSGSKTATASDTNLTSANIKCGTTIFGVTGVLPPGCVARTGQTTVYATGDDGAFQKGCNPVVGCAVGNSGAGYNRTSFPCTLAKFIDNGDGTVTDNLTGLIWLKDANCFGVQPWTAALTSANGLANGACGLSDGSAAGSWRLPNINELRSLIDPTRTNPALPAGHPFTGVQSYYYWSSTAGAGSTVNAWYVSMGSGYVGYYGKGNSYYAWPVRGGQ